MPITGHAEWIALSGKWPQYVSSTTQMHLIHLQLLNGGHATVTRMTHAVPATGFNSLQNEAQSLAGSGDACEPKWHSPSQSPDPLLQPHALTTVHQTPAQIGVLVNPKLVLLTPPVYPPHSHLNRALPAAGGHCKRQQCFRLVAEGPSVNSLPQQHTA